MALIPLKDDVTITKMEIDGWGDPIPGEVINAKGRVNERTTLVVNQNGEEISSRYTVYLDKNTIVGYGDEISFTDSAGLKVRATPEAIKAVKDYGGKVVIRKVNLR